MKKIPEERSGCCGPDGAVRTASRWLAWPPRRASARGAWTNPLQQARPNRPDGYPIPGTVRRAGLSGIGLMRCWRGRPWARRSHPNPIVATSRFRSQSARCRETFAQAHYDEAARRQEWPSLQRALRKQKTGNEESKARDSLLKKMLGALCVLGAAQTSFPGRGRGERRPLSWADSIESSTLHFNGIALLKQGLRNGKRSSCERARRPGWTVPSASGSSTGSLAGSAAPTKGSRGNGGDPSGRVGGAPFLAGRREGKQEREGLISCPARQGASTGGRGPSRGREPRPGCRRQWARGSRSR